MIEKFYFILLILLVSCENSQNQKPLPIEYGKTIEGKIILLGKINRANLERSEHVKWFKKEYDFYKVKNQWAESVEEHFKGINLKLFMGTWCEDSEREVPAIFKLLDAVNFDQNKIDVVFFGSLFGLGWDYKDDSNRWSNFFISRDECFLENFDTENINYFTFPDGVKDWRNHIYSYDKTYAYEHPNIYDNVVLADLLFDYIKEINS